MILNIFTMHLSLTMGRFSLVFYRAIGLFHVSFTAPHKFMVAMGGSGTYLMSRMHITQTFWGAGVSAHATERSLSRRRKFQISVTTFLESLARGRRV